jgi:hypothetical protein
MNIYTAAKYLEIGYRIRRSSWEPEEHISECAEMLQMTEVNFSNTYDKKAKKFVQERYISDGHNANLGLKDLLADDWEIITVNIRKHFNIYNEMEYIDDPDWEKYDIESDWDKEEE